MTAVIETPRPLVSITLDELEARVEKIVGILPEGLAVEWFDDLEEHGLLTTEQREEDGAVFAAAFWNAARIALRDLEAHGQSVQLHSAEPAAI